MAVKKTSKKTASIKSIKKEKSTNSENKLVERLQLKLEKSEEKIIELNEKYKKIIDIQKQKLENKYKKAEEKYKKIVKNLEDNLKKSTAENLGSSKSNKIELSKLQKKIEQLESKNAKLEAEKIKAEAKISKTARVERVAKDSSKETLKEIKELRKKLKESEEERKELTSKLKEALTELKKSKKNKLAISKEDKNQFKENIKILKKIKRENEILDKKRELLKKEAQKVKAIRSNIKDSARDIASTIRNSQVNYYGSGDKADSNLNPEYPTDSLNITDNEEELKKLATILCAAMDDYREQKESEEKEKNSALSEGEERLNRAAEQLEAMAENEDNLKRKFTIIDKIENSRVEINEGYSTTAGGQNIVVKPQDENAPQNQMPVPNITVKVEAPKESSKLAKPETQLKPASETPTMRMKLLDDTDDYEKKLVITYGFDNMPENTYYSKYKKILRNAARISLLGNLQEGLEMFKLIREQKIPEEYKQMIDKNIQDITYYLRGLHRVRIE
ncbi:hypothetical protein [Brachyspira aalborgi]|uniref:Uncharacterized protein n=1 Tax=Brachyspira aalborgi TaxID=29522 RepID=A0A5C8CHD1_9SPIR|nr:hypothetical protein [Brachyspira aalborgi]TXJ12679.1 hypothetical protein EPJ80_03495 [Brachyspira aalborgi]